MTTSQLSQVTVERPFIRHDPISLKFIVQLEGIVIMREIEEKFIQALQVRASSYFQLNQPTRCSNLSSLLLVVQIQLNMFRTSSCPSSGAKTTAVAASGLPSVLGDSSAVGGGRADRPDHHQQHCYHQAPTVNQRLLLQLLQLLMMGMRMPETC